MVTIGTRRSSKFAIGWLALLLGLLLVGRGARAEEDAFEPGVELRLSGTLGILTNLAGRVEDTSNYQASQLNGVDLESDPSVGFNGEVGYRFHPRISLAAHVEYLSEISISVENGGRAGAQAGDRVLSGESWALTGDARLFALTGRIQPFLVLGAGWLWADTDDEPIIQTSSGADPMLRPIDSGIGSRNGFVARAGGGVDVYLGESFFLTTQATYMVPVDRVRDFDYVSIAWGFGYRF